MRIVTAARPQKNRTRWVHYEYHNAARQVIFEKVKVIERDGRKSFSYRWQPQVFKRDGRRGVWFPQKPEYADDFLYHVPQILKAKASGADIWWTEGEKDADRLEEDLDGDDCTTTHHGGAGKITARQAEWFRGHEGRVLLCMDLDPDGPSGANPGAYDVILRRQRLLAVGIPSEQIYVAAPASGKDVFDHLSAGLLLDDLDWVTDLRPLQEKAKQGNGFSAWGYPDVDDEETAELREMLVQGWNPTVVPSANA